MWTYYPELLQTPVPRYTSYPTAADFNDAVGADDYAVALQNVPREAPVSLYVHIPFCDEICWYCGCNTTRSHKKARFTAYLDALAAEIQLVSELLGGRGRVQRISFGGGSPNSVDPLDFVRLLGDITVAFEADNPLISLEVDPRRLSSGWLSLIESAHIGNVSLGVQTFDPKVQSAIGRVQPFDIIATLTQKLRRAGVRSLNFDLMYGLPFQNQDSLMATLSHAIELQPDRIALFGYAHVPTVIPRQRRIAASSLPDAVERFTMANMGHDYVTAAGYRPVGFDHYALPNDPLADAARTHRLGRNFQGFTDDTSEYLIGLGSSAISQFPDLYVQNTKNMGDYRRAIQQGGLATERGVARDNSSRRCGTLIRNILCDGEMRLPPDLSPMQKERIEEFACRGLVSTTAGMLHLKPAAMPYARTIAAIFDPRLESKMGRFSAPV
ncbi:MAG: oxygen-independent coproporphyrinogen III oxidase [Sphingobium sp.]